MPTREQIIRGLTGTHIKGRAARKKAVPTPPSVTRNFSLVVLQELRLCRVPVWDVDGPGKGRGPGDGRPARDRPGGNDSRDVVRQPEGAWHPGERRPARVPLQRVPASNPDH